MNDWPRPLVHWELRAVDPEKQRAFYGAMFNWEIADGPVATTPSGIGAPIEGIGGHISQYVTSGFVLYFQVLDIQSSLVRAAELGGKAVSEPFDFPGLPTMAVIEDPEGNTLILVQQ